ncbi:uncharacterized protein TNCT_90671 [Trichonephila clavata]|uniref:Gustatory receptor n=1 Tax=Trichonephila clavata TaxID=2740835 RepID=A0A8X6M6E6_TRICU|nr:uncharacterized protein TNCT_90671 [Trichonephila clavata]
MKVLKEFEIILKSFTWTGVIFPSVEAKKRKTKVFDKLKIILKSLSETAFVSFTVFTIFQGINGRVESAISFKVTTITLNTLLLILRLSVLRDKKRILKTLVRLQGFGNRREKGIPFPFQKYSLLACGICILFPVSLIAGTAIQILINLDEYLPMMYIDAHNMTTHSKFFYGFFLVLHSIAYVIHYLMFPGMVMILLSFVYLFFIKSFYQQLESIQFRLLQNFSRQEVSRALMAFSLAKKIHRDIEETFSFKTFLAYVQTFGNILQVVCMITTDYLSEEKTMQILFSFTIFFWTIGGFVLLTICGTQVAKIEVIVKDIRQEVISKNYGKKPEGQNELACLNLYDACSSLELRFTAWGMFEVDKKLFLTISGVLVTYGVLFATEVARV